MVARARARAAENAHRAAERGWVKPVAKAIDRACPKCTGTGYLMGRDAEYARARLCSCREPCALCGDARYVLREEGGYEVAAPCECSSLVSRIASFNDAQIPAGYADKRLSVLGPADVHGFSDRGLESLKRAKEAVNRIRMSILTGKEQGALLVAGLGLVCALLLFLTFERGLPLHRLQRPHGAHPRHLRRWRRREAERHHRGARADAGPGD